MVDMGREWGTINGAAYDCRRRHRYYHHRNNYRYVGIVFRLLYGLTLCRGFRRGVIRRVAGMFVGAGLSLLLHRGIFQYRWPHWRWKELRPWTGLPGSISVSGSRRIGSRRFCCMDSQGKKKKLYLTISVPWYLRLYHWRTLAETLTVLLNRTMQVTLFKIKSKWDLMVTVWWTEIGIIIDWRMLQLFSIYFNISFLFVCLQVQAYYNFQPLTAYLSVNYLDRFLYSRRLPVRFHFLHC